MVLTSSPVPAALNFCAKNFLLCLLFLVSTAVAASPMTEAQAYLHASARADGAIARPDGMTTAEQATAEALLVVAEDSGAHAAALAFLDSSPVESSPTEYLARRMIVGGAPPSVVQELLGRQNNDGGFGARYGVASSTLDTSFALRALASTRAHDSAEVQRALTWLMGRRINGAWADASGAPDAALTLAAWQAIFPLRHDYAGITTALDDALGVLDSIPVAEPWLVAQELHAKLLRSEAPALHTAGLSEFIALQEQNGSWSNDVFTTAIAARVLALVSDGYANPDLGGVSGRLIDAEYQTALSGVAITFGDRSTVTDSTGYFEFEGIPGGSYGLVATVENFQSVDFEIVLGSGQQVNLGDIGLLAASGGVPGSGEEPSTSASLRGTALALATGTPLANVVVTVRNTSLSTTTNADGQFVFNTMPSGAQVLRFSRDGYAAAELALTIVEGKVHVVAVQLDAAANAAFTLQGSIVDAETGFAIAGAHIQVGGEDGRSATSRQDGSYLLDGLAAGLTDVSVTAEGYRDVSVAFEAGRGQVIDFSPRLAPQGSSVPEDVEGTVIGSFVDAETGDALPGVTVSMTSGSGEYIVTTDESGRFSLTGTKGSYQLVASLPEYRASTFSIGIANSTTIDIGEQLLSPEDFYPVVSILGVVVDSATGSALPTAAVYVTSGAEQVVGTLATDATFAVTTFGDREVEIRVEAEGYKAVQWNLGLADENIDIGQVRLRPITIEDYKPDLSIENLDKAARVTDPEIFHVAGSLRMEVRNSGLVASSASSEVVAFVDANSDSRYSSGEPLLGTTALSQPVEPGGAYPVELPLDGTLSFRDAPVRVVVDPLNAILEADESNNSTGTEMLCRRTPSVGADLDIKLKWHWRGSPERPDLYGVYGPVVVGQLSDDNDDGLINSEDTPDLVFQAHGAADKAMTAISGDDARTLWQVDVDGSNLASAALGDIDNDGVVEIVMVDRQRSRLIAMEHDGTLKWKTSTGPYFSWPRDAPAIADLDQDGSPEIVHGKRVYRADGSLWWTGTGDSGGYANYGFLPAVADIDLDGSPDVIAGRTAYTFDGAIKWHNGGLYGDGFTAVANFDDDDFGEIVLVTKSRVYILDQDGSKIWGPVFLPGGGDGGAPTVGDFDADGVPDIGIAGSRYYVVFNSDGSIKWQRQVQDTSSHKTGSSLFDFEADGKVEVLYADERRFFVFDGTTGETRVDMFNGSGTVLEYPIVVDVDNDDSAEIIVTSSRGNTVGGVRVLEAATGGWAPTRSIWNQHTYHITNINDDGSIPVEEQPGWLTHNTYRLNAFLDRNPLDAADLAIGGLVVVDNGMGQPLGLRARIGNAGLVASRAGITVAFHDGGSGIAPLVGEVELPSISPGQWVDIEVDVNDLSGVEGITALIEDYGADCDTSNHGVSQSTLPTVGTISVLPDATYYPPGSDVRFAATVTNTGSFTRAFLAKLSVEDEAGELVVEFPLRDAGTLASGEQHLLDEAWNTGQLLVGNYRIRARLLDVEGEVVDESVASFVVGDGATPGMQASLRLVTDRMRYHVNDQANFELRAANETQNAILAASSIRLVVTGPAGLVVFERTLPVRELVPGNVDVLVANQALVDAATGEYNVGATWVDADGNALATAERGFDVVQDLALALQGTVTVAAPRLYVGETQVCTEMAINTGITQAAVQLRHTLARLDQPWASIGAPFDATLVPDVEQRWLQGVQTQGMNEGDYACVLEAEINGAWQPLASAFFRLDPPPIRINAALESATRGRLLILLDPTCADADSGAEGDCDAEPYGPDFAPSLPIQREHLEAVLDAAGWTYTIVTSADAFAHEFRSKGYELYALFNEVVKLPEALQQDVVEDIAAGRGLLVAGNHDRRNGRLEEALGIKSLSKNLEIEALVIEPFGEHEGGEMPYNVAHWPNAVSNEGADVLGAFRLPQQGKKAPAPEPALTHNAHGDGSGTYAAFDWPAQSAAQGDDGELAGLLTASLDITHPDPYAPIAGRVIALSVRLQNEGMATPGEVHVALPPGVALVSGPSNAELVDGVVRWPFQLLEAEQESATLWLQLPDVAGPLTFEAVILSGEGDSLTEHVRTQTVLNVLPQE